MFEIITANLAFTQDLSLSFGLVVLAFLFVFILFRRRFPRKKR